ncbi:hypothetical protein C1S79_13080 [Mycolicibacterium phocaicum]|uniref:Uncharacterized protein n=1 Tax=Mycolicibacterium phocaicum TaxID=319706 RepID=A0AA94RCS6_9MYCO|nr:hypothetical protein [Mycolicibacterium phocaicum]TLH68291.1 hypothetical protein C1S79_13080 [Mycolicibacterium phocaicum]
MAAEFSTSTPGTQDAACDASRATSRGRIHTDPAASTATTVLRRGRTATTTSQRPRISATAPAGTIHH